MSRYAVYELFNGCEAPSNISTFGGYLAGVKVGTSDKNPLGIHDTTCHTSKLVRCKDCRWACVPDDDGGYDVRFLACAWWMSYSRSDGDLFVEEDDFCSHGEKRDDKSDE